jgi:hypothetical protein
MNDAFVVRRFERVRDLLCVVQRGLERQRAIRSGSLAKESGSTFSATSRFSLVSFARYTSPIPPAPRAARISYGPSFEPAAKDI